jgi:hypothetical protein
MRFGLVLALLMLGIPAAHADDDDDGTPDSAAPAEPSPAPRKAASHAAPAAPTEAAEASDSADGAKRCAPPKTLKGDVANAYEAACHFFGDLAARDPQLMRRVHAPFYFEAKSYPTLEDTARHWGKLLNDLGEAPATLYGLEAYTYDDMVKKYGKPPAKLESVPLRGAIIAVANVDGRPQVAALRRDGNSWMVFAFSD